jgi:hypothetical protein
MADNFVVPSNTIDLRLPQVPSNKVDSEVFNELLTIYTALRQLHNSVDKFLDIPAIQKTAAYELTYLDRGQCIQTTANVTVPKESNVGYRFPLGTTISIANTSTSAISLLAQTDVTLILAGTTATGTRTISNWGIATIRKIATDTWLVLGAGVS